MTPGQEAWIWVGVGSLLSLALLFWGFLSLRRKRLIENVPTSKVKGVFMGLNEVKGRARTDIPLRSFITEQACVYYRSLVEEHYSRTETYRDSEGKTRTRTVSGWKNVAGREDMMPFLLEDETGRLRVVPDGATIEPARVFSRTCGRSHPLYYAKGPRSSIMDSTHRRRFTEHAIPVGAELYVMGMARYSDDLDAPEIREDREAEMFLISMRGEGQITRGHAFGAFFKLLFGALFAFAVPIGFALPHAATFEQALSSQLVPCTAVLACFLGAVAVYYLTLVYNGLVSVRERLEMAWSMIDVQLKRRHVLIPRLVSVVQGYAAHERDTQRELAALRAGRDFEEQNAALRQVMVLAESYPGLKADANFGSLQDELVDTENRIALAREFYNGTVKAYNDRIQTLPDSLVAALARFRKRDYFAAQGFERTVPRAAS